MKELSFKPTRTVVENITNWWRNWRATRTTLAAFERCGPAEVKRIAGDVGLASRELRALAGKWPDSADELNNRLQALRIEPAATDPRVLRDLQRTCSMCESKGPCTRDLDRDPRDPRWRQYCSNVHTLDALLMETELQRAERSWRRRQESATSCKR
jgi:hypothetical protein